MSQLALLGGSKVVDRPLATWPIWDEQDRRAVLEVVDSGKWWMFAYGEIPKALKRSEQGMELYKTGRFLTITGLEIKELSPFSQPMTYLTSPLSSISLAFAWTSRVIAL